MVAERKITTLAGVREHSEGYEVELWLYKGRLVVRAYNEGSYKDTSVDLMDLVAWCQTGLSGVPLITEVSAYAADDKADFRSN